MSFKIAKIIENCFFNVLPVHNQEKMTKRTQDSGPNWKCAAKEKRSSFKLVCLILRLYIKAEILETSFRSRFRFRF